MTDSLEGDLEHLGALLHDLRTPLAAILGLALTLEREDVDLKPDEARDLVSRISENARRLDLMVGDLLDLIRIAHGAMELTIVPSDIAELAARVVEERDVIEGRAVIVEGKSVIAEVDPAKVERIVENLLSNSVRHTPPEGRIWLCVQEQEGGGVMGGEEEGSVVPAAFREAIFEPFGRGRDWGEFAPGSGID